MKSLSAFILLVLLASPAFSSVATFSGNLTGRLGVPNILDPLPRGIQVHLTFTDGAVLVPVSGTVDVFGVGAFAIRPDLGAAITHVGGQLDFNLVLSGGLSSTFTFTGFPGNAIDQPTIDSINFATTSINFNAPGTNYFGTITHTPEPSSGVLLAICSLAYAFRQTRSRSKLKSMSI